MTEKKYRCTKCGAMEVVWVEPSADPMNIKPPKFVCQKCGNEYEIDSDISVINNNLVDGCFDYDLSDGTIIFRMTNSYLESEVSRELFEYMLFLSFTTVDEYNDKLMMLSKGLISLAQFLESN